MNKTTKTLALIAVSALFALSFNSCGKDDIVEEKNKETKEAIVKQYLNQEAIPQPDGVSYLRQTC